MAAAGGLLADAAFESVVEVADVRKRMSELEIRKLNWAADLHALDPLLDDRDRQRLPALWQCAQDDDAQVHVAEIDGRIVGRITTHYRLRSEMGWLPDADTERFQSEGKQE